MVVLLPLGWFRSQCRSNASVQIERAAGPHRPRLQQIGGARRAVARRLQRNGARRAQRGAAILAAEAVKMISHLGAASTLAWHCSILLDRGSTPLYLHPLCRWTRARANSMFLSA